MSVKEVYLTRGVYLNSEMADQTRGFEFSTGFPTNSLQQCIIIH